MFDEATSLPMRAAIASLLGGLFGVTLILVTNSAQAQAQEAASAPAHTRSEEHTSELQSQ